MAPKGPAKRVFSVGHGTRGLDEFFAILEAWGVRRLVDVRRFPASRRHPHFARDALERECGRRGLEYAWMGETLGGFRDGGYEGHLRTREFLDSLRRLEDLAAERPSAFLCAERDPSRCHRRHIAEALERRGWTVTHILDASSALEGGDPAQGELW